MANALPVLAIFTLRTFSKSPLLFIFALGAALYEYCAYYFSTQMLLWI